jgi:outer membrane protein OmpA-like peptidoglycan-associated protein
MADALAPDMAERYGVSGGLIKPYPGFRAGAGYQWHNWRFSLESGYTYIKGDNPLVLDIALVPLELKAAYVFSFRKNLSIMPLLGAGLAFASVSHYETAIAMLLDDLSRSANTGFLASAALRLGWSFLPALTVYAGAGIDCVIESGGLIPLPALELGITIKPFLFRKKAEPATESRSTEPVPAEIAAPERIEPESVRPAVIEPEETGEEPAVEPFPEPEKPESLLEPEIDGPERIVRTLHFPAERAVPVRSHLVELDAAGALLQSDQELRVTLRGYTAPRGTEQGRRILSEARARYCENYLAEKWDIARERITVEWYGADRLPEADDGSDWRRRCVEIIIETQIIETQSETLEGGES